MEREEPRYEQPDLAQIQFSDRRTAIQTDPDRSIPLWAQIAVGVFLALLFHSIVTGLYARYEAAQALKQFEQEMKKLGVQLDEATRLETIRAQRSTTPPMQWSRPALAPTPLRDGERCIQGRRFKRLSNGWQHIPSDPC